MKKKKLLKRVAALALAATMVVGELPYVSIPVEAAEISSEEANTTTVDSEEKDSSYSVVGSPELGIKWMTDSELCFVKNNNNGTYSKKLTATAEGDFEFKILSDATTFAWCYQLQLGTGLFTDNASQFKLPGVVAGDEFVVTFNPETGDVVVEKNGVEFEYLVRWSTLDNASWEYLTKEEALAEYVETTVNLLGEINPKQIPAGETIFTVTGNMTNPAWNLSCWENQMHATNIEGVYCMDLKIPAYDENNAWMNRFFIGAFGRETLVAGWNRILLGVPTIDLNNLGNGQLGDLTNLSSIRIAPDVETDVTVYFDSQTYGLEILDKNGNSIEYQIGWCTVDDQETYYTPEQFAELNWETYISKLSNKSRKQDLEKLGVTELPDFVQLRNDLLDKIQNPSKYEQYVSGNWKYRVVNESEIEITKYLGNEKKVSIPKKIDEKKVIGIGKYAFMGKGNLQVIELPDTVKEISDNAFYGCSSIVEIVIPASVEVISEKAFAKMENLYDVIVSPENLNYVSSGGILFNKDKTELVFCPLKKSFENGYCGTKTKYAKVETGVLMINGMDKMTNYYFVYADDEAPTSPFATDSRIKDIVILGNKMTNIGDLAFYGCTGLTKLTIPSCITEIGTSAFCKCENLTDIEIGPEVANIGDSAFDGCPNLTIHCEENSVAHKYAMLNSINYKFFAKNYTVTFDANGGVNTSVETKEVEENTAAGTLPTATREGYIFKGWYTDKTTGTEVTEETVVTADMTVYARWEKESVTLTGADVTVADTSFTYDGTEKEATVTVKAEGIALVKDTDYTVSYKNNVNAGTATVTVTGMGRYKGTIVKTYEILPTSIENAVVTLDQETVTYDGTEQKPNVAVKLGTVALREGTDYTVTYKENINVGTATVTVTAEGNYAGTITKNYTITPASIENAEVNVLSADIIYDGTAKEAIIQVIVDNKVLKKDKDYTVTYADNTNIGTAKSTITGIGNYTGTVAKTYEIKAATVKVENVTLKATEYIYDGTAKQADVIVKAGAATLVKDADYKVVYANNTEAGTAIVTVTGMGNYAGTVVKEYTINPCSVETAELTLEATELTFNGMEQNPAVQVTLGEKVLVNGTDYNVTYTNNKNTGLATVTVTGIGNYNGSISKEYKINAYNIENAEVNILSTDVVYDGTAKKINIQVIVNNSVLKEVEDYSILYLTNTNAGTAKFGLVGHGNYTGSVVKTFEIEPATIKKSDVTVEATEYIYDGKAKQPSATVTMNGKTLKKDVDYTVTYEENTEVGYGRTIITGIGNYAGTVERMLRIKKASLSSVELAETEFIFNEEDQEPKVTVKSGSKKLKEDVDYEVYYKKNYGIGTAKVIVIGIGSYTGKLTESFKIMPQKVNEVTQTGSKSAASITLTWTATPGVSGYEIYRATSKNGDYTMVKYQSSNTYKDVKLEADTKYYYKVRAYRNINKVKYYGEFSKVMNGETIVAAPEFTLTASEEAVTVNWDKSKGADGYEVYMASSKKATFKNIKSANTNGRRHKKTGLKSGKTYYFKVRAYQLDASGKKIYSTFSEIQEITVK